MVNRRQVAIAAIILIATIGVGYAITSEYVLTENVHLDASDGPEVVLGSDNEFNQLQPFPDANTVALSPKGTFSSNGYSKVVVENFGDGGDRVHLDGLELDNELEIEIADHETVRVSGGLEEIRYGDIATDTGDAMYVRTGASGTVKAGGFEAGEVVAVVHSNSGETKTYEEVDSDGFLSFDVSSSTETEIEFVSSGTGPSIDDDSADPVGEQQTPPDELSVIVEDDLGDEITVEFELNGDPVGSDTVQSGERASVDININEMGTQEWSVTATDQFGVERSSQYEFALPGEVEIRNENTTALIDDREVTVRFFPGGDDDDVVTETTTDGVLDMSDVPVNEDYIVQARTDGFHSRTIHVQSVTDISMILLLEDDADTVLSEFELEDRTGDFGVSDEGRLVVQKAISINDEQEKFRTVTADEFGADKRVAARLERGERYRLVVENNKGDSRNLGSYTAERDEIVPLEVGTIRLIQPEDGGYVFDARMANEEEHGQNMARITFTDDAALTKEVTWWIHVAGNQDNVVYGPVTTTDPQTLTEVVEVPDDQTLEVTWEATRDGEEIGGTTPIGTVGELDIPVSGTLLQTLGISAIILLGGLFGGRMSRTGALIIVVVAWGMRILGLVTIPYVFLVTAGMVAVMFKVGDTR